MPDYDPFNWFWIVGGDESRYWSSAAGAYVPAIPDGAGLTRIASEQELTDVLVVYGLPGPIVPRKMVLKSVVQARIISAGKMGDAYTALTSNPVYFARWFAPDRPEVYCDDPDAVGLVKTLGLDPSVILAP